MLEHIVLAKVNSDHVTELTKDLISMVSKIPGIIEISAGVNKKPEDSKGYNYGLIVRLTDTAARETYGSHPSHMTIVNKYLMGENPIVKEILELDFEH